MLLTFISRETGTSNLVITQVDAESGAVVSEKYMAPIAGYELGSPGPFRDDCVWYSNDGNLAIRPSYLHRDGRPIYLTTLAGGVGGEVEYVGMFGFNLLQVGADIPPGVAAGFGVNIYLNGSSRLDIESMLLSSGVLVRIRREQEWAACFFGEDGEISTVEEGVSSVDWPSAIGFSDGSERLVSIVLDEVTGQTTVRVSSAFQPGWNPETIDLSFSAVTPACIDGNDVALMQAYCAGLAQEIREHCATGGIGDVISMQGLHAVYEDGGEFYLDDYGLDALVAELSGEGWRLAGDVPDWFAPGWSGTEVVFSVDSGYSATELSRQDYNYVPSGDLERGILLDMRYSPPLPIPPFWTGLQRAVELIGEAS